MDICLWDLCLQLREEWKYKVYFIFSTSGKCPIYSGLFTIAEITVFCLCIFLVIKLNWPFKLTSSCNVDKSHSFCCWLMLHCWVITELILAATAQDATLTPSTQTVTGKSWAKSQPGSSFRQSWANGWGKQHKRNDITSAAEMHNWMCDFSTEMRVKATWNVSQISMKGPIKKI